MCEVIHALPCVWVQAWERSKLMPTYGAEILHIQPPTNRQLQDTSAWINEFTDIGTTFPAGWVR
jgi:hypothetical protein